MIEIGDYFFNHKIKMITSEDDSGWISDVLFDNEDEFYSLEIEFSDILPKLPDDFIIFKAPSVQYAVQLDHIQFIKHSEEGTYIFLESHEGGIEITSTWDELISQIKRHK